MTDQRPTYLYFLAHIYLKDLVIKYPEFFTSVVSKGPDVFEVALKETFNKMKIGYKLEEGEVIVEEGDFSTSMTRLENDLALLLIKFPKPRNTAEVSHVGIILSSKPRYFTLEAHFLSEEEKQINPEGKNNFCVCEWDKENKHTLYTYIDEDRPGLFAGKIQEILRK